jgi:peptide deformylase
MNIQLIPDNDPCLHTKTDVFNARKYPDFDETIVAMFELMRQHDGMGLAAPQVGISKRFFIMTYGGRDLVCINPRVLKRGEITETNSEGCLSYPGQDVSVERATKIKASYLNQAGLAVTKTMTGLQARCFLHELDHLDGIVMGDVAV